MSRRLLALVFVLAALVVIARAARADDLSTESILGKEAPYFQLVSVTSRIVAYDQYGRGYQSRAGPVLGPGDERVTIFEPMLDVVVKQGKHITHDLQIPVDIVTAASPDAIDLVSTASRINEAGEVDWTATYASGPTSLGIRNGFHGEENWRSWNTGANASRSFAEDNTVVAASFNAVMDWFDKYTLDGKHDGHASRSTLNGNASLVQLLSPTTIFAANYGLSMQRGQLTNGWNTVPRATGDRVLEVLPRERTRHALVGRVAQHLPWNGALKLGYRFYADDWGIDAHSLTVELDQRLASWTYVGATYRLHHQTGASFFTTRLVDPATPLFTADSDLADLTSQTLGFKANVQLGSPAAGVERLVADVAFEHYFRSNDLRVNIVACGIGLYFQ